MLPYYPRVVYHYADDDNRIWLGNGTGTVDRVVTSDTKGPRFESSQQQLFIFYFFK